MTRPHQDSTGENASARHRGFVVTIDAERCKGCELCIHFCPRKIIGSLEQIDSRGVHSATVQDSTNCTGCLSCVMMCPDLAIQITREPEQ